jgi:MFS family permease
LRLGADIPRVVTIVLAGLISLGAVALDITLVALPATARALGGDPSRSGLIVTAFLAGFAPGQLLWGFLGDRIGRRRSVLAGLICLVLATAACALAPTFGWLLAARCLQGMAAAVGPVLRPCHRQDFASEIAGARLLSLLTAVVGTVPLLAPLVGAALLAHMDWRSIFWLTALVGSAWFMLALSGLPEDASCEPAAARRHAARRQYRDRCSPAAIFSSAPRSWPWRSRAITRSSLSTRASRSSASPSPKHTSPGCLPAQRRVSRWARR